MQSYKIKNEIKTENLTERECKTHKIINITIITTTNNN